MSNKSQKYLGNSNLKAAGVSVNFTPEQIDTVRWIYRTLCLSRSLPSSRVAAVRERAGDPLVDEYLRFIDASKRGLCLRGGRRTGDEG